MKPATKPAGNAMSMFNAKLVQPSTQRYISDALPQTVKKYLTPDRMSKLALSVFSRTPALWKCTPESLIRSIVECASLGLEPTGGALAQAYLVPYGSECQLVIAYQGMIELARRSGEFQTLDANAVYARDKLVLRYGFDADFSHEPYMGEEDRGELVGAYCIARFKNGEKSVAYMRKEDIEKRRMTSQVGRNGRGPWSDWYAEMAVKTVIKKAAKMWPKTSELAAVMERAIDVDRDSSVGSAPVALPAVVDVDRSDSLADKVGADAPEDEMADELEARWEEESAVAEEKKPTPQN
jgi:recombination protein RecT